MTFSTNFSPSRIGGAIPIVYTYFTEFLQMDKRGEHLSWLCMFWMLGGLYASFTAWGIIPHYGNTQHLIFNICFNTDLGVLTHSFLTGLQVGASPLAQSFRCTAGDYLSSCVSSQLWLHLLEWSSCQRALVSSWRSDPVMQGQKTKNEKHMCFHALLQQTNHCKVPPLPWIQYIGVKFKH